MMHIMWRDFKTISQGNIYNKNISWVRNMLCTDNIIYMKMCGYVLQDQFRYVFGVYNMLITNTGCMEFTMAWACLMEYSYIAVLWVLLMNSESLICENWNITTLLSQTSIRFVSINYIKPECALIKVFIIAKGVSNRNLASSQRDRIPK